MKRAVVAEKFEFISQHELKQYLRFKQTADEHTARLKEMKAELLARVDEGAVVEEGLHRVSVIEKTSIPYKAGLERALAVLMKLGEKRKVAGVKKSLANRRTFTRYINVK